MNELVIGLAPVFLSFLAGLTLKMTGVLQEEDGTVVLKIVFFVTIPALVFKVIYKAELTPDLLLLPFIAVFIILLNCMLAFLVGTKLALERPQFGVLMVASMIMNLGFNIPFVLAAYGEVGLARASLIDLGNGILSLTFVYAWAVRYGSNNTVEGGRGGRVVALKIIKSPPVWGLLFGLFLNLLRVEIPTTVLNIASVIGDPTSFLFMVALGIMFNPKIVQKEVMAVALFLRMGLGLIVGLLVVILFDFDLLTSKIIVFSAAAPVGFNTLTFATLEGLDTELATSIVSVSVFSGLFVAPLLLLLMG